MRESRVRKHWTQEEIEYLDEKRGHMTPENMAKALGRTTRGVHSKMWELGLKSYIYHSEMLTYHEIDQALGISDCKVERWVREGLPMRMVGVCHMIHQDDLVRELKKRQDEWSASAVRDDTIFSGQQWYLDKKERDKDRAPWYWSDGEVAILKRMYREGCSYKQISREIGRSPSALNRKMCRLRRDGWKL